MRKGDIIGLTLTAIGFIGLMSFLIGYLKDENRQDRADCTHIAKLAQADDHEYWDGTCYISVKGKIEKVGLRAAQP